MERLTERHYKKSTGYYMKCSEYCEREESECFECEMAAGIVNRLGYIEDILGDEYDLDRLRELVEANKTLKEFAEDVARQFGYMAAWSEIAHMQAADVVEVVRCQECKHLNVINDPKLYAHCPKTNTIFLPCKR